MMKPRKTIKLTHTNKNSKLKKEDPKNENNTHF